MIGDCRCDNECIVLLVCAHEGLQQLVLKNAKLVSCQLHISYAVGDMYDPVLGVKCNVSANGPEDAF